MTKIKQIGAVLHKKSAVSGKTPTAAQLELGELAVNYNADEPFISFKDNADNIVKISPTSEGKPISGASGVDVNSGGSTNIISGVVDPSSENVITEYTTGGTSAETQSVLSVGANGFKVDNIQTAIDTKAAVNHKVYDPVAGVYEASSHTITYSAENGELFTTPLTFDDAIDSASTNAPQNKVVKEELDKKLDKVNFLNQIYPKGSIYITETNTNPSTFIGGTWELIGGEDADKNYYPAFAISTDTAGTTINESLPNIKADANARYWYINSSEAYGAFSPSNTGTSYWGDSSGQYPYGIKFDASKGQTKADGTTYVPQTASTYQNGAQVNVNAIKLFFWRRTDDAPIAMMLKPVTLERTKDVLWSGNSGNGTISLSGSMADYDAIEFTFYATGFTVVQTVEIDKVVNQLIIPISWDANVNRYGFLTNITNTSFSLNVGTQTTLRQVRGIKYGYVSRTDITSVINSESTNDKAAGAKAVYDALAGIQFINRSKNLNWGGSTASFTADITCEADEVPLGKGATNVQTEGAVGYGYVSTLTKLSDTSYRLTGWVNGNGASIVVVNATFVKMK